MMLGPEALYYASGAILAFISVGGFLLSKYRTGRGKVGDAVDKIEGIESSVEEIKESQQQIRRQQERADERQEELVAAIVAVTQHPRRVDPDAIEEQLTEDDKRPSPSDFYNGRGVDLGESE